MNRIFISSPIGLSVRLDGGAADISIITGAIADISTFDDAHFLFRKVVFLDMIHFKRFHGSRVLGFIQQIFIGFLPCDGVIRIRCSPNPAPKSGELYYLLLPFCVLVELMSCRTRFCFPAGSFLSGWQSRMKLRRVIRSPFSDDYLFGSIR